MNETILFVYNWVPETQRINEFSECATTETVDLIDQALTHFGMRVKHLNVRNPRQMSDEIKNSLPLDAAFVIAEGFLDEPSSLYDGSGAQSIRKILEQHNLPYTHSGADGMEACRNKDLTYKLLQEKGIAVPRFFTFPEPDESHAEHAEYLVGYPMFLKPSGGGNSIGVDDDSIVRNRGQLSAKLISLQRLIHHQPVIAETFLSGREYTVGVIGNGIPYVMPIVAFPEDFPIRSQQVKKYEYKERNRFEILAPADPLALKIRETALKVYDALPVKDLIRIDLKQDEQGGIFVIDVNGTPSLASKGSLAFSMEQTGISHREMVAFLLYTTLSRCGLPISDTLQQNALQVIARLQGGFDNQVA